MSTVLTDTQAKANIGANVRRLRGERTLSWLAREVETSPIHVSRIEQAVHLPSAGLLARLAEALGTTADALLSQDATKNIRKTG